MEALGTKSVSPDSVVIHPLDPEDAAFTNALRTMVRAGKGASQPLTAGRAQYDALLESVAPRDDVTIEAGDVGGVTGTWVRPIDWLPDAVILHLHGGWFNLGSAKAYRHLVGHIAARAGARAFIADYRLAPEFPFPAATDDALKSYRGLATGAIRRIAITGDSAGGNLALGLGSRVTSETVLAGAKLVAIAVLSPVTDLTLSGQTYDTRAEAEFFFTRTQVAELVQAYLGGADAKHPLASPLHAKLAGMPPIRVQVGDDEVLLADSLRYAEAAAVAGVDAQVDVWMGMPHGFPMNVGKLKAAVQSLDAVGAFLKKAFKA
jgi:monoterpene epsilon-lactone hydrolase